MNAEQYEQAQLHLAILGPRPVYHVTAKNHITKDVKNDFLKKEEVAPILASLNDKGYTTWVSINPKEKDCIEGVTALADFWLDIDARPKGIDDRPATPEEMQEALERSCKLKNFIENQYAALGFMANSGNGFHIHFPLPIFDLPFELRAKVNKKVTAFAKTVSATVKAEIDRTYDISRRTTLIGTENKKLVNHPIQTQWDKDLLSDGLESALKYIENAREQNKDLLAAILATEEIQTKKTAAYLPTEKHADLEQLLRYDQKLYDLLKAGDFKKYGYNSRSEAEEAILVKLVMEGFTDPELNAIMETCALGKWQEKGDSYRNLSIEHAREQATKYIMEKQQDKKNAVDLEEFNPITLAKEILEDYTFVIEEQSRTLFVYDKEEKRYTHRAEEVIKREMAKRLDDETRSRYYSDVFFFINGVSPIKPLCEKPELILCENGVLNVLTVELGEPTPEIFLTNKIPVQYNPKAECPKITEFLKQTLDEKQLQVAQEFIGYCLYRETVFRKAYIANGPTGTGKTVHQRINTALIGEENITNQTIQAINHSRFAPAELYNKMGNFCDDMPASILKATGNFKIATGHGRLSAEKKGKDPFEFYPYAKFWLNCNQLAKIAKTEDTDAYHERLLIQNYKNQVKTENPNLANELCTPEELSGYLNFALAGLKRLMKQKHFSEYMTRGEVRKTYMKQTEPAKYFIETCLSVTDEYENYIFHDDLFRDLVKLCHSENISPIPTKGELTHAMNEYCTGATYTKIRHIIGYEGKKPIKRLDPAWRYLKIVPNVQNVQPLSNKRENIKRKKQNNLEDFDEQKQDSCTNGTNGTNPEPYFTNCYFCQKPIETDDFKADDYTEHKPAHKKCYVDYKAQLRETQPDFSDKEPSEVS